MSRVLSRRMCVSELAAAGLLCAAGGELADRADLEAVGGLFDVVLCVLAVMPFAACAGTARSHARPHAGRPR